MRHSHRSTRRAARRVPGQKPRGCFQDRVQKVGPDKFSIIAVDCGKASARLRVADFYGNVLLEPFSFEISRSGLQTAGQRIEEAFRRHAIEDCVAAIETTGRYHRPVKQFFAGKHWDPRDVHPYTSNLFRRAADESNKTDDTDLAAIHRAAVDGLAMRPEEIGEQDQQWRVLVRHRRDLVQKAATLKAQFKEAVHAYLPNYASLWSGEDFWESQSPAAVAVSFNSPSALQEATEEQIRQAVREAGGQVRIGTIRRIQAWSHGAAAPDPAASAYHRRAVSLWRDLRAKGREIRDLELDVADFLCGRPAVLLLAFPGINVVSASDYGAELGPLTNYATSKSIAGRAGIYPSRYQTSMTDLADGPLSARRNRQLRSALLRVARNLQRSNHYYMSGGPAGVAGKVVIARKFSRLSYYVLAGEQLFVHAAIQDSGKILRKLLEFYHEHHAEAGRTASALNAVVNRLRLETLRAGRQELEQRNQRAQQARRHTPGVRSLAEILPAVLLRIDQRLQESESDINQAEPSEQLTRGDAAHGS